MRKQCQLKLQYESKTALIDLPHLLKHNKGFLDTPEFCFLDKGITTVIEEPPHPNTPQPILHEGYTV